MKQKLLKTLVLLCALIVGSATSWAANYAELFTITSENVVSTSGYKAYTATVSERGYVITFGGNNRSVGTNSGNRSKCNLLSYSKYAVSPVTTNSVASAFATTTSISDVAKISYTISGGKNQTSTKVYLLYSSDNSTFSQLALTSGTQGANISTGTSFTFEKKTGYFALLFEATNKSGDWRIDDVSIKFYKEDTEDLTSFEFSETAPSVTLSKIDTKYDAEYSQNVTVAPADYDGDITYSFVDASSTFDLNDAIIDEKTGEIQISAAANINAAKTIVVKASATATAKYNKPEDATYTLTVNPAPDGVGIPIFSLATGSYYYGTTFTISSANSNNIYYTTDGTTPSNTNGTLYSGAIAINSDMTVKAIGYDGETASEVATINYMLNAPEVPTFSVAAGGVTEGTLLTLTVGDGGTKVVYTTDGTDPTVSSDEYTSAIAINNPTTIKAASVDGGNNLSAIVTNAYTIVVTKEITLWSEDFSDYSADDVPSDGTYSYECADGASTTKIYEEKLAGGTSPELLVNKSGYFQATIPLDNISGNLTLTYYTNNTNLTVSSTTEGVTLTGNINPIGSKSKSTVTISGVTTSMKSLIINFAATGGNCRLDNIVLKANMQFSTEPVTVSAVGYATYCSANALDFTASEVKAYVGTVSGGNLTFTPVTKVPANTGLLLYKKDGAMVNVPVIASADPVGTNCLTGVNEATSISSDDYILNKVGENVGFYKAGSFTSLAAHRAYITSTAAAGIKNFVLNFDETDGIVEIMRNGDNEKMSAIFDLSGRRVSKPTKGIYVKNGRKFIVK